MPPASPKIYHITHVNNLPSIIAARELISDAAIIRQGGPPAAIGMSKIGVAPEEIRVAEDVCADELVGQHGVIFDEKRLRRIRVEDDLVDL